MKSSLFDKDTGKFLFYGDDNNPKFARLALQGHLKFDRINGNRPNSDPLKVDLTSRTLVVDEEKKQERANRTPNQRKADLRRAKIKELLSNMEVEGKDPALALVVEFITLL